jgi:anti-sigma factor RsiW
MNCPKGIDWKAYALNELDAKASEASAHLASCDACRDEYAGVQMTLGVLSALREEELPRRIAFVSDKVFEPRWWQRMFNPTFASACVLAGALVFHATYSNRGPSEAEIQARINQAVAIQVEERTAGLDQMHKQVQALWKTEMGLVNF